EKANRIYRINSDIVFGGNKLHLAVSSDPMGAILKKDYPEVEEFVRFYASSGSKLVKKGNTFINEMNVAHADSTLFDVFTLPALSGNTKTALSEPNTVVITESTAKKYFNTTEAVGKTIETNDNNRSLYKVTAVIKDIPRRSHFNFDFIFSMDNVDYQWGQFGSHNFQTYLLLKKGTDPKSFEQNFKQFIDKYVFPFLQQYMNVKSMSEMEKAGNTLKYSLIPLTDIHLHSDRTPELAVNGSIQYVYIFSAVALFVLLLACVNFMNLSTARSAGRAKEVGIRKVLGTQKKSLVSQFLTESVLMTFLSLLVAVIIVWAGMSYFNNLSGKDFSIVDLFSPSYLILLIVLPLAVGLMAGSYPAFYLSSFKPIAVLKGKVNAGFKKSGLRNVLVVFQFATSILLIVCTIIVYKQLNFIQTKKLGFNKEQVLVVNNSFALGKNASAFKNEISKLAGVQSATFAGFLPVNNSSRSDNTFSKEAVMDSKNGLSSQVWHIDYDYIPTLGMQMLSGRNFSKDFGSDSNAIIINETTARFLGFDNPIGKKIYSNADGSFPAALVSFEIVGVVKNFHYESLKQTVGPLLFRLGDRTGATAFKISTTNVQGLVKNIEDKWRSMASGMTFSYQFLDESFNDMYKEEQRTAKLGLSFAIIAILIACLGLFGLATYMAEQRIKEIGVRKVLGATVANITGMLSKDFLKLVSLSAILAFPVAWWAMHNWLQDFAFRVDMSWWVFALAGGIAIFIALVTVSSQAIKAALSNPVKSLRAE
ncbi:MAG: ABC transporter permease, partial [Gloeobacteraceae cyanobacterium ES-bin-316]|nr:ABC transporter permease [Ferruginibacter sp.]